MLKRMSGLFLLVIAAAVAVHTIVEPLYHTSSETQMYSPLWVVLDPLMVLAVVLGVIFGGIRKRAVDSEGGSGAITREFLAANTLFYGFLSVGILLLWNWFNQLSPAFTADRSRRGYNWPRVDTHRCHAAAAFGHNGDIPAAGLLQQIDQLYLCG